MSEITVIEVAGEAGVVIEVVGLGPQGPAAPDLSAAGLAEILAGADGAARAALVTELKALIGAPVVTWPSLPLPVGARLAAIGDSQIAFNVLQSGAIGSDLAANTNALGFIQQALAIDPRFRFDSWYQPGEPTGRNVGGANQGVFGDHLGSGALGGIVGRLPQVLAGKPDVLVLQGGSNTISSGDDGQSSAAYVIAKLEVALMLCRQAGVPVILMTIYPRGDWPVGDARHQAVIAANSWIRAQYGREGVVGVLDTEAMLAPAGVQDVSLFMADKVHLSTKGAIRVAREGLLPILQRVVAPGRWFELDPAVSNLHALAMGQMAGTAGTRTGGIVPTGVVANNCILTGSSNASAIVASKEVVAGALEAQVLDITPADLAAGSYGQATFSPAIVSGGLPSAGQWVRAMLFVETGTVTALSCLRLQLAIRQGTTVRARNYALTVSSDSFGLAMPGRGGIWLITEPLCVPEGVTFDRIFTALEIYWDKLAPAFQLKISRPIIRTVADPNSPH